MNNDGHPATLIAAHPANTNAVKSGVYSRSGRLLSSRAAEIADVIMTCPLIREADEFAAAEVGRLVALIEAIDDEIEKNGLTRRGDARSIVKLRLQASRRLEEWLDRLGFTWSGGPGEHDRAWRARGRDRATASPAGRELKCGPELQDNPTWSALEDVGAGQLSN